MSDYLDINISPSYAEINNEVVLLRQENERLNLEIARIKDWGSADYLTQENAKLREAGKRLCEALKEIQKATCGPNSWEDFMSAVEKECEQALATHCKVFARPDETRTEEGK